MLHGFVFCDDDGVEENFNEAFSDDWKYKQMFAKLLKLV